MRPGKALSLFAQVVVSFTLFSTVPLLLAGAFYIEAGHWPLKIEIGAYLVILSLTLAGAFLFSIRLVRPVWALLEGIDRTIRGDLSVPIDIHTGDEWQTLGEGLNKIMEDRKRFSTGQLDELVAERAKTAGIIYSSEDGILLTDQKGTLQLINPKGREILGLTESSRDSLGGRPIWSFVKDDRLAVSLRESIEGAVKRSSREINLSADTIRCFYSLSTSPITPPEGSGAHVWVISVLRNITAEKELNQLKDDFLQSLTHDLRSPMTAIRGYLQVLSEEMAGPLTSEQQKMLHVMENASTKLLHIISNLLDTAKMSAGKLKINLAECSLRQLIPNTVELFHTEAAKKKITLTLDMPETIPSLKLDPLLIERVLINLIGNAIKFTPEGGFVTVKFIVLSDRIQGQVMDTGMGFPPEFMSRIFKKFEQVSGTRGGTGLGLAICKFILDAHMGEIGVRSKTGEGTTFTFTIPKGLEQNEKGDIFLARPALSA